MFSTNFTCSKSNNGVACDVIKCSMPERGLAGTCSSVGLFVCVEVLRPSQPNGVMSSAVSLPNHTFTGQV